MTTCQSEGPGDPPGPFSCDKPYLRCPIPFGMLGILIATLSQLA